MELQQVRYFIALADTLNFTRAAEICNVTQPALTRAIQRLEDELGGPLLFRERNLTRLTELGRTVQPHLQTMLDSADAARKLAELHKKGDPTSLTIGIGPGISPTPIISAVSEIARMMPRLAVNFQDAPDSGLIDFMLNDEIDCALLSGSADLPERVNRWPLYTDQAMVVLPLDSRLGRQSHLTSDDLAGETILLGENCGGFGHRLVNGAERPIQTRRCGGTWQQMLELVTAGLGVALLSTRLTIPASLAAIPLSMPKLTRNILLTSVAGRRPNAAVAGFIKLCRAQSYG
ncbi:MAG: LysR family transcriptional regulator [Rhodospirillales bacterium 20-60-12]|nr:MAG: LysR family transcriptional regulator [Rhodospirillales bacterium 20-60-12]HQT68377.1 LysR family transcriptional regulator [Acetobacteraceae bacterium]